MQPEAPKASTEDQQDIEEEEEEEEEEHEDSEEDQAEKRDKGRKGQGRGHGRASKRLHLGQDIAMVLNLVLSVTRKAVGTSAQLWSWKDRSN